jgi:predicted DNA-binding protein (MmcQ/YjbR family)
MTHTELLRHTLSQTVSTSGLEFDTQQQTHPLSVRRKVLARTGKREEEVAKESAR